MQMQPEPEDKKVDMSTVIHWKQVRKMHNYGHNAPIVSGQNAGQQNQRKQQLYMGGDMFTRSVADTREIHLPCVPFYRHQKS